MVVFCIPLVRTVRCWMQSQIRTCWRNLLCWIFVESEWHSAWTILGAWVGTRYRQQWHLC